MSIPHFEVSSSSRSRTATGIETGLLLWALRFLKHEAYTEWLNPFKFPRKWTKQKNNNKVYIFMLSLSPDLSLFWDFGQRPNAKYIGVLGFVGYLLELLGGVLNNKSERFLCLDSRSGVSSTTKLAIKRASSSQPAMAATDLNLGLNTSFWLWPPTSGFDSLGGFFESPGIWFGSSLTILDHYRRRRETTRALQIILRRRSRIVTNTSQSNFSLTVEFFEINMAILTAIIAGSVLEVFIFVLRPLTYGAPSVNHRSLD